jgi:hypothetical protein
MSIPFDAISSHMTQTHAMLLFATRKSVKVEWSLDTTTPDIFFEQPMTIL